MGQDASKSKCAPASAAGKDPRLELAEAVRSADRCICLHCVNMICAFAGDDKLRPKRTLTKASESSIIHHDNVEELLICGHACSACEGIAKLLPHKLESSAPAEAEQTILLKERFGYGGRLLGFQLLFEKPISLRAYADSSMSETYCAELY